MNHDLYVDTDTEGLVLYMDEDICCSEINVQLHIP